MEGNTLTSEISHAREDDGRADGSHDKAHGEAESNRHVEDDASEHRNNKSLAESGEKNQAKSREPELLKLVHLHLQASTQYNNDGARLASSEDPRVSVL